MAKIKMLKEFIISAACGTLAGVVFGAIAGKILLEVMQWTPSRY